MFRRLFWTAAIALSAMGCWFMIAKIKTKMDTTPIIVTLAGNPTNVLHAPFPAVTFCPLHHPFRPSVFDFFKYSELAEKNAEFRDDFLEWVHESKTGKRERHFQTTSNFRSPESNGSSNGSIMFENPTQRDTLYKKLWALAAVPNGFRFKYGVPAGNGTLGLDEEDMDFLLAVSQHMSRHDDDLKNKVHLVWKANHTIGDYHFKHTWTESGICRTFNMMDNNYVYRDDVVNNDVFKRNGLDKHFPKLHNDWDPDKGFSNVLDRETYPWRAPHERIKGKRTLTAVMIDTRKDIREDVEKEAIAFWIVLHQPQDHPQLNEHASALVKFGKLSTISARLEVITTSPDLENYDPRKRQCYYSYERHLKYFKVYSKSNCMLECFTNISLKTCGCVHVYMPRFNSTKVCGADANSCISRAMGEPISWYLILPSVTLHTVILKGQADKDEVEAVMRHLSASGQSPFTGDEVSKCDCMPACLSITYEADTVSSNELNVKSLYVPKGLPPDPQNTFVFTGARIGVQNSFFIAIQRSEYYGQIDFLANCGGFLGLFCGFSILSFIEILYFLTIRIFANIYRRLTSRRPPVLPVWLPDAKVHEPRIAFEDLRI